MKYSREDIIKEYKKLRERIGGLPDSRTFHKETRVTRGDAIRAFGPQAFSKIQREASDNPNIWGRPGRNRDDFFIIYGKAVRDLKGCPSQPEWLHRKIKPVANSYKKQLHLRWSQMPGAFCTWASDKPEWKDVVEVCRAHCEKIKGDAVEVSAQTVGYVYLMKSGRYYKLGRTSSVGRREYDVALQLPEPVKTVHFIETDDPTGIEAYWHKRFEGKRKQGEWFDLSPEDVRAFKNRKSM